METAAVALEKHVARAKAAQLRRRFAAAKERMERESPDVRIRVIKTADSCGHGCRHCGAGCGKDGKVLELATVEEARERRLLNLNEKIILTGGEPLDHPRIVELVRRYGARVGVSNGFSRVHGAEAREEVLGAVGDTVWGISFHLFGGNGSREELIRNQVLRHGGAALIAVVEQGNEGWTAQYFFRAALKLARDPEIIAHMKRKAQLYAGYTEELPFMMLKHRGPSIAMRVGMGTGLRGVEISDAMLVPEYTGTVLAPDGSLLSEFFYCECFRKVRIGSVGDQKGELKKRMREAYLEFVERQLAKSDDEMAGMAETDARAVRANVLAKLAFWKACAGPGFGIPGMIEEIKARVAEAGCEWDGERMVRTGIRNALSALNGEAVQETY